MIFLILLLCGLIDPTFETSQKLVYLSSLFIYSCVLYNTFSFAIFMVLIDLCSFIFIGYQLEKIEEIYN